MTVTVTVTVARRTRASGMMIFDILQVFKLLASSSSSASNFSSLSLGLSGPGY